MKKKNRVGVLLAGLFLFFQGIPKVYSLSGDIQALEKDLVGRPDILFFGGFEGQPWTRNWGLVWGPSPESNGKLLTGPEALDGNSYQVTYPAGSYDSPGGLEFRTDFSKLSIDSRDSLYLRYYVRFERGFDFGKGGKLPGLGGGSANTGGHKPDGTDGWSARIMWRAGGRIVQYVYHPDQPTEYGEDFPWDFGGCPKFFTPGQWECVETYARMNDPGKHNGVIVSWLNGEKALEVTNLRFRDRADLKIDKMLFETFFGGGDSSWASPRKQSASFDNFVMATNYIGPDGAVRINSTPVSEASPVDAGDNRGLLVFDGDHPGWKTSAWSAGNYDFHSGAQNHTLGGKQSVLVQLPSQDWGAVQFEGPLQKPVENEILSFWVYPTGCDLEFRVRLEKNGSEVGVERPVTGSAARIWKVNQWNRAALPLGDFNAPGGFNRIVLTSNNSQAVSAFYLDDIYLSGLSDSKVLK